MVLYFSLHFSEQPDIQHKEEENAKNQVNCRPGVISKVMFFVL